MKVGKYQIQPKMQLVGVVSSLILRAVALLLSHRIASRLLAFANFADIVVYLGLLTSIRVHNAVK